MAEIRVYYSNRTRPVVTNGRNEILYRDGFATHNRVALYEDSNPTVAREVTETLQPGQKFVLTHSAKEPRARKFADTCYTVERVRVISGSEYVALIGRFRVETTTQYRGGSEAFYDAARVLRRQAKKLESDSWKKSKAKGKKSKTKGTKSQAISSAAKKLLAEADTLEAKGKDQANAPSPSLVDLVLQHAK